MFKLKAVQRSAYQSLLFLLTTSILLFVTRTKFRMIRATAVYLARFYV